MPATTPTTSATSTIIYVTRDIERALGMAPGTKKWGEYFIVANKTPYAEEIRAQYPDYIFLVEHAELADTHELLADASVQKFISKKENVGKDRAGKNNTGARSISIVVFKNTLLVERICDEKKWRLLNPSSELAEKIENKITQVEWLGDLTRFLPEHQIVKAGNIQWGVVNPQKEPFIIQWAHSHTGDGTALVRSEKDLAIIKEKFPKREARVSAFIKGPMFTANICVGSTEKALKNSANIFIGNISYQITGVLPFTDNPFSTIGNDWSVTHSILTPEKIDQFNEIALAVGEKMSESGWRGLFGIDCIYDEERDEMRLIEINARQPASTTYESQLQENIRNQIENNIFKKNLTVFEGHLAALRGEKTPAAAAPFAGIDSPEKQKNLTLLEINDGAQIIQRLTVSATIVVEAPEKIAIATATLRAEGFKVIEYENTTANSDLLRIQSARGIMEAHLKFNARGKKIVDILLT